MNEIEPSKLGRPPLYTDPTIMQAVIDDYFKVCDEGEEIERYDNRKKTVIKIKEKRPYTVPGLAYHLGFDCRDSLLKYCDRAKKEDATELQKDFFRTIRRAKTRIEQQRNQNALTGAQDPRFSQFDLSCNFGWIDKKEVKLDVSTLEDKLRELESRPRPGEVVIPAIEGNMGK